VLIDKNLKKAIQAEKTKKKRFLMDYLFKPDGHNKTFNEMSKIEKNKISPRGIAFRKLKRFLIKKQIL